MPTIADLNVAINANTTQYVMGLQKAGESTEGFTTKGRSAFSKFGAIASGGLLLAAGAAAGFAGALSSRQSTGLWILRQHFAPWWSVPASEPNRSRCSEKPPRAQGLRMG